MNELVKSATFVKGAVHFKGFPEWDLQEIAFAGRSNVGKSSALRLVVEKRCKVRVSSTPGRTREINFFSVELRQGGALGLVDLPGFGFAKVPLLKREEWAPLVESYIEGGNRGRGNLCGMVVLCDLRRGPEHEENLLVKWLETLSIPFKLVFTKSDKLPKNRRKPSVREGVSALDAVSPGKPIIFSAKTGEGVDMLWNWILKTMSATQDSSEISKN